MRRSSRSTKKSLLYNIYKIFGRFDIKFQMILVFFLFFGNNEISDHWVVEPVEIADRVYIFIDSDPVINGFVIF